MFSDLREAKVLKPFRRMYVLTLASGAQIYSEFPTEKEYREDLERNHLEVVARKQQNLGRYFTDTVTRELAALDPKKQPIFNRKLA